MVDIKYRLGEKTLRENGKQMIGLSFRPIRELEVLNGRERERERERERRGEREREREREGERGRERGGQKADRRRLGLYGNGRF